MKFNYDLVEEVFQHLKNEPDEMMTVDAFIYKKGNINNEDAARLATKCASELEDRNLAKFITDKFYSRIELTPLGRRENSYIEYVNKLESQNSRPLIDNSQHITGNTIIDSTLQQHKTGNNSFGDDEG